MTTIAFARGTVPVVQAFSGRIRLAMRSALDRVCTWCAMGLTLLACHSEIPTSDGAPRTPTAAIDAAPSGGANEPSGPERFVQLTSSRPICARSNKGRVYCWGASSGGLLGDDDASTSPASPVAIPALDGASDLAVGGDRQTFFPASGAAICALRHGGEIWRWRARLSTAFITS